MEDRQVCTMNNKQFSVKPGRDRLGTMFARQQEFQISLGNDVSGMSPSVREKEIDYYLTCISQETAELRNELNWKRWNQNKQELDLEQARFEVIDLFKFLMNIAFLLGMDAEMFFQMDQRKGEINVERQKTIYKKR